MLEVLTGGLREPRGRVWWFCCGFPIMHNGKQEGYKYIIDKKQIYSIIKVTWRVTFITGGERNVI